MSTLKQLNISQTGIAFDPQTGDSFQLNETAKTILELQQQNLSVEEIAQNISGRYQIPFEQALTDTLEFEVYLKILGLVA